MTVSDITSALCSVCCALLMVPCESHWVPRDLLATCSSTSIMSADLGSRLTVSAPVLWLRVCENATGHDPSTAQTQFRLVSVPHSSLASFSFTLLLISCPSILFPYRSTFLFFWFLVPSFLLTNFHSSFPHPALVSFAFNFILLPFLSLLSLFLCFPGLLFLFYILSVFILAFLSFLSYFVFLFSPFYVYLISFFSSFICLFFWGGYLFVVLSILFTFLFLCFVGHFLPYPFCFSASFYCLSLFFLLSSLITFLLYFFFLSLLCLLPPLFSIFAV